MPVMSTRPCTDHAVRPVARRGMVVAGLITAGLLGAPLGAQAAVSQAVASPRQAASVSGVGGIGLRMMPRDDSAVEPQASHESDWTMLGILGGAMVVGVGVLSVYLVRRPA